MAGVPAAAQEAQPPAAPQAANLPAEEQEAELPSPPLLGTSPNPLPWPERARPVSEKVPGLIEQAFPHLFPYGAADFNVPRPIPVTRQEWVEHLFNYYDMRFTRDTRFTLFIFSFIMKEKHFSVGNLFVNRNLNLSKSELIAQLQ